MAVVRTGVVYIQKDKFQFYSPYVGRVLEFRFIPEIIRDLDVVNNALLENYIKVFVTNSKITPSNLVFVLAENAYFTKDFLGVDPKAPKTQAAVPVTKELLQKQADEFVEHVPFDNVVSKTIPIKDGLKVCATNKDFYEAIAIAFEHLGFTIDSVVPGLVLGNGLSLRPIMDPPMANLILQKITSVSQYNLLNQQVFQPRLKQETEEVDDVELERAQPKKSNKKNVYALAGIVPVLGGLAIALYVQFTAPPPYLSTHASTTPPTPQVNTPVQLATIAPTVATTTVTTASASAVGAQSLTVQIVNTSSSPTNAQSLLGRLDTYQFASVSLQTQSAAGSSSTLVSFSPAVSQDVRTEVLTEVRKVATSVAVQEKQLGTYDVTIVLGE